MDLILNISSLVFESVAAIDVEFSTCQTQYNFELEIL